MNNHPDHKVLWKLLYVGNLFSNNVENMIYMFSGCASLESLNLSSFNTSKVKNMSFMFGGCSSLKDENVHICIFIIVNRPFWLLTFKELLLHLF